MMIHQVPLLPNVEVQVPHGSVIPLPRGGKISSLEKLVALFSKLVRLFEPLHQRASILTLRQSLQDSR